MEKISGPVRPLFVANGKGPSPNDWKGTAFDAEQAFIASGGGGCGNAQHMTLLSISSARCDLNQPR